VQIEIFSDVACPWSYITQRRLIRAIETGGLEADVQLEFRAFEINPDIPKSGRGLHSHYGRRFGSGADVTGVVASDLEATARAEGLEFDASRLRVVPNTFNAHRLVSLGQDRGLGSRVLSRLFRAYFAEGIDIGDSDALVDLAREVGFTCGDIASFRFMGAGKRGVRRDLARARHLGVRDAPTTLIDRQLRIEGPQSSAVLGEILYQHRRGQNERKLLPPSPRPSAWCSGQPV